MNSIEAKETPSQADLPIAPESAGQSAPVIIGDERDPGRESAGFLGRAFYVFKEIVITLLLFLALRNLVVQARFIPSASMHPGLLEGDRLLVELVTKHFSWIGRGDILVFYKPGDAKPDFMELLKSSFGMHDDRAMIKRVIGMPGDVVEVIPGVGVRVNGAMLEEPYIEETSDRQFGPITVPDGNFFMMGDNRNHSLDSRSWGTLPRENVIGEATVRFYPFDRLGWIR